MTLTIIVCTLPERKQLLTRCLFFLEQQRGDFDVLVMHGSKGYGTKLMAAYKRVSTSHVMTCDDDDWLSPRLVETVLPFDEDSVTYDACQTVEGQFTQVIPQEVASHTSPLRLDLAVQVPFGDDYLGDIPWTRQVAKLCESHRYIPEPLYFYDKFNPPGAMSGWSPPRNVGFWPHDKSKHYWA